MPPVMPRAALALAGFALACLGPACGASEAQIRRARTSGFEADFAVVYTGALEAVRDHYPRVAEDARIGVIRTGWHQVRLQSDDQAGSASQSATGLAGAGKSNSNLTRADAGGRRYFARFTVAVVGGKPWRVRIEGEASRQDVGAAETIFVPLRGAAKPPWLDARVDALQVAIFEKLEDHAVALRYQPDRAAPARRAPPTARWAGLPAAAVRVIAAVHDAAEARDVGALRPHMIDEFVWSFGDGPSADVAIAMWSADPAALGAIQRALDGGCGKPEDEDGSLVCPTAALADGFVGERAGFAELGGTWKMTSFVAGD